MPEGGLGLQYALTPRSLLGVEWRFQHFSNANISRLNPGLNLSRFLIGFSFVYIVRLVLLLLAVGLFPRHSPTVTSGIPSDPTQA